MRKRENSLDLIRIYAFIGVVGIHFFLHTGFYATEIIGGTMYLSVLIRTIFLTCVPLFIVLTGYLMGQKELNKEYYRGIKPTLVLYFVISIIIYVFHVLRGEIQLNIIRFVSQILSFKAAGYSWYVEMYIGLFLLIPFLNIIYKKLTFKEKKLLLLTCLFLTSIPLFINSFNYFDLSWWSNPTLNSTYSKIVPAFWTQMYPITYYFIGCFFNDKDFENEISNYSTTKVFLAYASIVLFISLLIIYRSNFGGFVAGDYQSWGSLPVVMLTVVNFILIKRINLNNFSSKKKSLLKNIANSTFGAYLISQIFDELIYSKIVTTIGSYREIFPYLIIVVPIIACLSICSSLAINLIIKMTQNSLRHK